MPKRRFVPDLTSLEGRCVPSDTPMAVISPPAPDVPAGMTFTPDPTPQGGTVGAIYDRLIEDAAVDGDMLVSIYGEPGVPATGPAAMPDGPDAFVPGPYDFIMDVPYNAPIP